MKYQPTRESVDQHPLPEWFDGAKLGIFIHWGLYSVPAFAPLSGELPTVVAEKGWAFWFTNNPYAEWYLNSMRIEGSPTHQYHLKTYGEHFSYDDFGPLFNQAVEKWDPKEWTDLFRQVGARYVVLTTKHHDGFLLWPSRRLNPFKENYATRRDLVGELTDAVRASGMRMGLYYSGGLDWTFNPKVIRDIVDLFAAVPQSPEYVEYANAHWRELIERYQPSILWNDIAYPAATDLNVLFADYYNRVPDGVVNDRFTQHFQFKDGTIMSDNHFDFRTPEYATFHEITPIKWETTRGIGYSFGYNQNEGPDNYLSVEELIHLLADIVSKNGNLLLNVGPMADGTLPELQRERLLGLGQWLAVNGEAIFDTRPWIRSESHTSNSDAIRFTQKKGALYAIVLAPLRPGPLTLEGLLLDPSSSVHLLGYDQALDWQQHDAGVTVTLPPLASEREQVAYALRIVPCPQCTPGR